MQSKFNIIMLKSIIQGLVIAELETNDLEWQELLFKGNRWRT